MVSCPNLGLRSHNLVACSSARCPSLPQIKPVVKHLGTIVSVLRSALPKRVVKERPEDPVRSDADTRVRRRPAHACLLSSSSPACLPRVPHSTTPLPDPPPVPPSAMADADAHPRQDPGPHDPLLECRPALRALAAREAAGDRCVASSWRHSAADLPAHEHHPTPVANSHTHTHELIPTFSYP